MLIMDGDRGQGGERVKARPRVPTQKTEEAVDRHQNNGSVKAVSLAIARQLVYYATAVSTVVLVRVTRTVSFAPLLSNYLKLKKVQLSQPSSTSVLMVSSGLHEGPAPPPSS